MLLEFLGLPNTGKLLESGLKQSLIENVQGFLMELGKDFAFVAWQQRISTGSKDFHVDLIFYNYLLKCFVPFDLTTGELTHQAGQMDMYVSFSPGDAGCRLSSSFRFSRLLNTCSPTSCSFIWGVRKSSLWSAPSARPFFPSIRESRS